MIKSVLPPVGYERLIEASVKAQESSRSPYSGIRVGAAAMIAGSDEIVAGANWESPSYPAGVCAERSMLSALFASHGDERIEAVAITASHEGKPMDISPCGICRQSLLDAQNRQGQPFKIICRYDGA